MNQLAQGQSQLDAAKDSAKESADLDQILTVDMLGNLLAAQNFSMPAGYVGEGENATWCVWAISWIPWTN